MKKEEILRDHDTAVQRNLLELVQKQEAVKRHVDALQPVFEMAGIFGFTIKVESYGTMLWCILRGKSCRELLPLFEFLEYNGYEVNEGAHYTTFNRTYHLTNSSGKYPVYLDVYFNQDNCTEVVISETVIKKTSLICNDI